MLDEVKKFQNYHFTLKSSIEILKTQMSNDFLVKNFDNSALQYKKRPEMSKTEIPKDEKIYIWTIRLSN